MKRLFQLKHFEQELLKPMRRMDDDFSYIPSQYLVDTIKSLGYVGVMYRSVMNKDGTNFALFDEKLFSCEGVSIVKIRDIDYDTEKVD